MTQAQCLVPGTHVTHTLLSLLFCGKSQTILWVDRGVGELRQASKEPCE